MWFRKRSRRDEPQGPDHRDAPTPSATFLVERPVPPPLEYATVLVGNVLRIPGCEAFADELDRAALSRLAASIDAIEEEEVVGTITRPDGDVHWEPHPLFAEVGVRRIVLPHEDLDLVIQPDPAQPDSRPVFAVLFDDFESELDFQLKDLALPG